MSRLGYTTLPAVVPPPPPLLHDVNSVLLPGPHCCKVELRFTVHPPVICAVQDPLLALMISFHFFSNRAQRGGCVATCARQEMGSGDPEVLPSGLHRRCASVDQGSMSEDEVELPVFSVSAVPFPCGAPRPMLDPG